MPTPYPCLEVPETDREAVHAAAVKILLEREAGKKKYKEADELLRALIPRIARGFVVSLADGRKFQFVDNFEWENVSYKVAGVNRFDLVELSKKEAASLS